MKLKLQGYSNLYVTVFLLSLLVLPAQQLKTSHDGKLSKGHNLYKQSKLYDNENGSSEVKPLRVGDRAQDRIAHEVEMLKNPYTGMIPPNIRMNETAFSDKLDLQDLSYESKQVNKKAKIQNFVNRGPYNVGGRTRALAIDRTNEDIIIAGGVSGGVWRTEDGGQNWTKVSKFKNGGSITGIIQDPRPGKELWWYYISGERAGNSASAGGAFYTGSGVFKSRDGGLTWRNIKETNDFTLGNFSPFDLCNSIDIDPTTGEIYVGTFNGIFRGSKRGKNWEEVLPGGFDAWTEAMVTPSGQKYATIASNGSPNAGFFTSADGLNWTNITPPTLTGPFGRTVMSFDPSDENVVYFFTQNQSGSSEAYLYRYDASNTDSPWTDLTSNLPGPELGQAGGLNLQGGYNMVVKVHPTLSNLVFVGGTNIYRSFDAFTTPAGFDSWIAGYGKTGGFVLYPNQHPDQHVLTFFPSNPNMVLTGNDGGVQKALDITEVSEDPNVPVNWISLNNGYRTTQPYGVAIDKSGNSTDILAGFQDNGTWFNNSEDPNAFWEEDFGGDGCISAISNGGLTRYVSSQRGNLYRLNFDETGAFISFTLVTPASASDFPFVTNFILDENDERIMYLPAGNSVWRNDNLDGIPLFSNSPTDVNWNLLTTTPSPNAVTALATSRFPVKNRLYFGNSAGQIYKMDNANLNNQEVVDISSGKNLPPGNVNNISVDPNNSDRVFVAFSNYGIPSVFVSEDAGETWEDISGNIEENPDGTGNGPSVRWITPYGKDQGYYLGTSTGLYFTRKLKGAETKWKRTYKDVIGNVVVQMIQTRSDGFMAVATHGNGLFTGDAETQPYEETTLFIDNTLEDIVLNINDLPDSIDIDVSGLFLSTTGAPIDTAFQVSSSGAFDLALDGDTLTLSNFTPELSQTTVAFIASSNGETASVGFTVSIEETPLLDQFNPIASSVPAQNFLDFGALVLSADDFVVADGNTWTVDRVTVQGGANGGPIFDTVNVVIYEDVNGAPGDEVYSSGAVIPSSTNTDTNFDITLDNEAVLDGGTYWIAVYPDLAFNPGGFQWFWASSNVVNGNEAHFKDEFNLFGAGATTFTPLSSVFLPQANDLVFQIYGSSDVSSESVELASLRYTVSPNPSADRFNFKLKTEDKEPVTIQIFDFSGNLVHEGYAQENSEEFYWDASGKQNGIYIVKLLGAKTNQSFKVVKF